jgi:hypothetical protein
MPNTAQELEHARLAVERFVDRFDESYRLLAFHAALPLVLTPELLSFLRTQFLRGRVPWVAEADLLLATDLCRQVGYEQYALEPPVRAYLIGELRKQPDLGVGRMQAVARLLIDYVRHQALADPSLGEANLRAQEWSAMVFLDDERRRASQAIAEAFREAAPAAPGVPSRSDRAELARLVKITQALAPELGDYPELIDFAEGLGRMLADPRGVEFAPAAAATAALNAHEGPDRASGGTARRGVVLPTLRAPASPTPPPSGGRKRTRVFVSSTYRDLKEYRERVDKVLGQMGFDTDVTEGDTDTDERPLSRSFAAIAACDVYIGIIAWRYGHVPTEDNPEGLSITLLEYRHASRLGKPRFIFLMEEDAARPAEYLYRGEAGRRIHRFRKELISQETVQFFRDPDQLAALVANSMHRYSSMEEAGQSGTSPVTEPRPDARPIVYLAEVTDEVDSQREVVRRYLEEAGLRVLPTNWYPREVGAYRSAAETDMRGALLFVQLLGQRPGLRLTGDWRTPPELQYELATRLGLPILQWRSLNLETAQVEDDQHRKLLESPTVFATGLEEFKATVLQWVRELSTPAPPPVSAARTEADKLVFVNAHEVDIGLARQVGEALTALGVSVALPLIDGEPSAIADEREWLFRTCDALLLIHDRADVTWVRREIRDARDVMLTRKAPPKLIGVYQASSEPIELGLHLRNMRIIDGRRGVAEAHLEDFLKAL